MLRAGIQFATEATVEYLLQSAAEARYAEHHAISDEQKEFNRRIQIAQNVLGIVCPPAGRAMVALEYGPIIVADGIKKVWDSDIAKCLGDRLKRKL